MICKAGYYLKQNTCTTCTAPGEWREEAEKTCYDCTENCIQCASKSTCKVCALEYFLDQECCTKCPASFCKAGSFGDGKPYDSSTAWCAECSSTKCLTCPFGKINVNGVCHDPDFCDCGCQECETATHCNVCSPPTSYLTPQVFIDTCETTEPKEISDYTYLCSSKCAPVLSAGYFLDTTNKICYQCTNHCLQCATKSTCTKCEEFYFLRKDGTCAPCLGDTALKCKVCSDESTCTQCDCNYFLYTEGRRTSCVLCDQNGQWKDGVDADADGTNYCYNCVPGCKTCSSKDTCKECVDLDQKSLIGCETPEDWKRKCVGCEDNAFYPSGTFMLMCSKRIPNGMLDPKLASDISPGANPSCISCASETVCYHCGTPDYFLKSNGMCECCGRSGVGEAAHEFCEECDPTADKCKKCKVIEATPDSTYIDDSDYFLQTSDKTCRPCYVAAPHVRRYCQTCNIQSERCRTCKLDTTAGRIYGVNPATGYCELCSNFLPNCYRCNPNESNMCVECFNDHFYLKNGRCYPITDKAGCLQGHTTADRCTRCKSPQYVLDEENWVCNACACYKNADETCTNGDNEGCRECSTLSTCSNCVTNVDHVLQTSKAGCTNCEEWVTIEEGLWGTWQSRVPLSPGKYACGWRTSKPSGGDKLGIDYIQFRECDLTASPTPANVGSDPSFGVAATIADCPPGKYIRGIQVEFLPYQGPATDDEAIVGLRMMCFGRKETSAPSEDGCQYDNWRNEVLFGRKYICGYQVRTHTTGSDKTGLNGLRVKLCAVY